ncbi:hypothetical protein [Bradyrhizobium pachyrhizi]|uniref:hypothetical protein n=1 Tax=Bradyrhizobium pachyrhizi TaxID=280333 RepID=UPI003D360B93
MTLWMRCGLMTGLRDILLGELKHNVVALTRAARTLSVPVVATTTARDSMWGPAFPELAEALHGLEIIDRSSVNGRRVSPAPSRPPAAKS